MPGRPSFPAAQQHSRGSVILVICQSVDDCPLKLCHHGYETRLPASGLHLVGSIGRAQFFTHGWPLFRPDLSYQLTETGTPSDTVHILQLQPGTCIGPDSAYLFVERATKGSPSGSLCGRYVQHPDNLLGNQLRMNAAGTITLSAQNDNVLTII